MSETSPLAGTAERRQKAESTHRVYALLQSLIADPQPADLAEFKLVADLGASRTKIRAALSRMAQEGVVTRAPRQGTHPRPRPLDYTSDSYASDADFLTNVPTAEVTLLSVEQATAPRVIARRLGLGREDQIVVVEKLWRNEGRPFSMTVHYVPLDLRREDAHADAATLAAAAADPYEFTALRRGSHAAYIDHRLSTCVADESIGEMLEVAAETNLLLQDQTVVDADGSASSCSLHMLVPHAFTFALRTPYSSSRR